MNSIRLLSDLTVHLKYARYLPELKRRETWPELVNRNKQMHLQYYQKQVQRYPLLRKDIDEAYKYVEEYKILPSMRSAAWSGRAILEKHSRMYNCCYLPIDDITAFKEVLFLLLSGTGVGFSVQHCHIERLPPIYQPTSVKNYYIGDSIEHWSDAMNELIKSFTDGKTPLPIFKGDLIRPKGSIIQSIGELAPGPDHLLHSLNHVKKILLNKENGSKLRAIEIMDIIDILSECVLAGGVRRSSLICLFSPYDEEMLHAKSGSWWLNHPWRARSNNSAMILRGTNNTKYNFENIWSVLSSNHSGEPGIYFTDDYRSDYGSNPCVETSLRSYQFCNLTEINSSTIISQTDFNLRARYAALLGSLQAGYTHFNYLRSIWQKNTEQDALLGIGLTGICHGNLENLYLRIAAKEAVHANVRYSKMLGLHRASRVCCTKPSGTTSLVLGCSSGIHPLHAPYYIRHVRVSKDEPIYEFLNKKLPDLIEDEIGREDTTAVIKVPQQMNFPHATYRNENVFDFLERIKYYNQEWVLPGHIAGPNKHNVSATVSIKEDEWEQVGQWMWNNRLTFHGMACLPYFGGEYHQAPFTECSKYEYERLYKSLKHLDFEELSETENNRFANAQEPACAGGVCSI